jgi:hypothetical protein
MAGAYFNLIFDRNLVDIKNTVQGDFFRKSGITTFFNPGNLDNSNRTLRDVWEVITIPRKNATARGGFVKVNIIAKNAGTVNISLTKVILSDPNGKSIPLTLKNSTITIFDPSFNLLSDDFSAPTIDTSIWTFINPRNDATYNITGIGTGNSLLSIFVPAGLEHDVWNGNNAPRIMQNTSDIDFEIETKFQSLVKTRYQLQGVIIQQDINNYIRFDFHSDGSNTNIFAATFSSGSPAVKTYTRISGSPSAVPLYMRVKRAGNQWTMNYSFNGTNWTTGAIFTHVLMVTSVGPFAGNALGSSSPAFTGLVDYFFNTYSPIVPEDGGNFNDIVISTQPQNKEVEEGGTATFSVVATGTALLSYQWQKNGSNIHSATSASYTTQPTTMVDNGSTYRVNITNPAGSVTSDSAILTVTSSSTL